MMNRPTQERIAGQVALLVDLELSVDARREAVDRGVEELRVARMKRNRAAEDLARLINLANGHELPRLKTRWSELMNENNGGDEISTSKERCMPDRCSVAAAGAGARALNRVIAEIREGLRHGHFEYTVSCEMVGGGRRRLQLRAGKSYQYDIPAEECETIER